MADTILPPYYSLMGWVGVGGGGTAHTGLDNTWQGTNFNIPTKSWGTK